MPKPDFITKNGQVIPLTGKGGKKGRSGKFVAATTVAIAVAAYGGGLGAGSMGGAADSAMSKAVQVRTTKAKQSARKGQRTKTWKRMRLKVDRREFRDGLECAVHSFGQVRQFFLRTPCRSLKRALLMIGDEHGNTAVISIAWVRMSSTRSTNRLKKLDDVQGTGDVYPFAGWALEAQEVHFTGKHYASRRSRSLFVRAEAAPASGSMDAGLLEGAAKVAKLLPPP